MTPTEGGRPARFALLFLLVAALPACSPALRDPGPAPVQALASTDPAAVEKLLRSGDAAFAERTIPSVRRAALFWLEAASADGTRVEGWTGLVQARAWLADHESDRAIRKDEARKAVEAGQWCESNAPDDPRCAYWLAVALGVQARERQSTALDGVGKMIARLRSVIERTPEIDHAGPHRVLAMVYLRAPGWPTGPGDPDEGLLEARLAIEISPEYPPNQLCLAEALEATEELQGAREALREAARLARERAAAAVPGAGEWLAETEARLARLGGG